MPHWVLVDDTDSGISYTGPWFADHGSQDTLGNFGVPYQSTLHGTTSDASFSYTFQGTRVLITGTQQYSNTSAVTNPFWECLIDNKSVSVQTYSVANNRLLLCQQDGLTDAIHTITLKAHVSGQRTFWFDYIQYVPSATVPLDQVALFIDVPDPQMQFGTGWAQYFPGYKTSTQGSTFQYEFNGVSATWVGFYDNQLPFASSTGTYTIDGGSPTAFTLNGGIATTTGVQYNEILFQTPTLPAGSHRLAVTYEGNNLTTPLTLSVMVIQNGTSSSTSFSSASSTTAFSPISSPSTSLSSSATSTPSTQGSTHSTSHAGVIVGAVIGVLALILALILLFLFLRRRKSRQSGNEPHYIEAPGFDPAPMRPYQQNTITSFHPPASFPQYGNPFVGRNDNTATSPQTMAPTTSFVDSRSTRRQAEPHSSHGATSKRITTHVRNVVETRELYVHNPSLSTSLSHATDATIGPQSDVVSVVPMVQTGLSKRAIEVGRPRVARDEDSGIRLEYADIGEVVMLPPAYTHF